MANLSISTSNTSQVSTTMYDEKTVEIVRTSLVMLMLLGFCSFLYFIKILLSVYFTTEHLRDSSRYILFAHMLITDTVYLLLSLFMTICSVYLFYLPFPVCYVAVTAAVTSFIVTPYNLAAMSLERYVAVCFPLRHARICSVQNTFIAIAVMWVLGLVSPVADFTVIMFFIKNENFAVKVKCSNITVTIIPLQDLLKSLAVIMSLAGVGTVHLSTYIKVVMAARRLICDRSSASKAGRTVLLHAFQLLLCMTSLVTSLVDSFFKDNVLFLRMLFFFVFMCLPRFLSPLIYGLRDEILSKYIKKIRTKELQ